MNPQWAHNIATTTQNKTVCIFHGICSKYTALHFIYNNVIYGITLHIFSVGKHRLLTSGCYISPLVHIIHPPCWQKKSLYAWIPLWIISLGIDYTYLWDTFNNKYFYIGASYTRQLTNHLWGTLIYINLYSIYSIDMLTISRCMLHVVAACGHDQFFVIIYTLKSILDFSDLEWILLFTHSLLH